MDAIIYTSNTGYTAAYATMLGRLTDLPVYSLDRQAGAPRCAEVIYLGWLMAGTVQGYAKAARRYRVRAVCAVGLGPCGSRLREVRRKNKLEHLPLFILQGGFDLNRLHGPYRVMMTAMVNTVGRSLALKKHRTPEETDLMDLLLHGGSRVRPENLEPVLDWLKKASV